MFFEITKSGRGHRCGDLFYNAPMQSTIDSANNFIRTFCNEKRRALYGSGDFAATKLEKELQFMEDARVGFDFLILKEIADFSREQGYPVMLRGSVSGSVILFLLGVTQINPMPPHYRCSNSCHMEQYLGEDNVDGFDLPDKQCPICGTKMLKDGHSIEPDMIWGEGLQPIELHLSIAEPIRNGLRWRLNEKFSNCESEPVLYQRIFLPGNELCRQLGEWENESEHHMTTEIFGDKRLLKQILEEYVDERIYEVKLMKEADSLSAQYYENELAFFQSLQNVEEIDFGTFTRLIGYRVMRNAKDKDYKKILDKQYPVFCNEGVGAGNPDNYWSKSTCINVVMSRCLAKWYANR